MKVNKQNLMNTFHSLYGEVSKGQGTKRRAKIALLSAILDLN